MEKIDKKTWNKIRNYMLKTQEKGLITGIDQIDGIMGGLKKGEMTVIGGWQAIGKTAFVLSLIDKICIEDKKKCILISTRACKEDVIRRLIHIHGKIADKEINEEKIDSAINDIDDSPLYIDDEPVVFLREYITEIRRHTLLIKGVDLVVIDDIQNIGFGGKNIAEKEVNSLIAFKELAKELDCHVIVTSILNSSRLESNIRAERERKIPRLSDFGAYRAVLNYADNIMLLNRPYYFDLKEDKHIAHNYLEKGCVRCPKVMDLFYYPEYGLFSSERLEDVIEKNNN